MSACWHAAPMGCGTSPCERLFCRGGGVRSRHLPRQEGQRPRPEFVRIRVSCRLSSRRLPADTAHAVDYLVAPRSSSLPTPACCAIYPQPCLPSDRANRRSAWRYAPSRSRHPTALSALHATELLLRTERFDEAAAIILDARRYHEQDHVGLRLLSATQMLRGRAQEALEAIDRALALAPEAAEYHLHRANLLYRLGRLDEAAEAFGRAAALDPVNPAAKRSQLTVYFDSGRFTRRSRRRRADPNLARQ